MGILNRFFNKHKVELEKPPVTKSAIPSGDAGGVTFSQLFSPNNGAYNAYTSLWIYSQCAPIYIAVDHIVESYTPIPVRIYDSAKNEYLPKSDYLNIIEQPNPEQGYHGLVSDLCINYLVTGNAFLMVTYGSRRRALEMYSLSPAFMQAVGTVADQPINYIANEYLYSGYGYSKVFTYDGEGGYVSADGFSRLFHIRDFVNTAAFYQTHFGISRVHIIYRESQLYGLGNLSNLSVLKRGMFPSGVIEDTNPDTPELTEEQFERFKTEIASMSGAQNQGKTPIMPKGFKFSPVSMSNVDMQYTEQLKNMVAMIANAYKIPVALISSDTMTYNNLQAAKPLLLKGAVLPLGHRINETFTRAILRNTNEASDLIFKFNESDIPELRNEEIDSAKGLKQTGAVTVNEIRASIGLEAIEGGDDLIQPSTFFNQGFESDMRDKGMTQSEIDFIKGAFNGDKSQ